MVAKNRESSTPAFPSQFSFRAGGTIAPFVRRALACSDLVEGAPLRFHPHVGVPREHGARDVPRDAHDDLVACAHSRARPSSQPDGHDATRAPTRGCLVRFYHLVASGGNGGAGGANGAVSGRGLPPPGIGVCWGVLGWGFARHGASWGVARKSMKTW